MRIRIFWEGKTKNPFLRALQADYVARISHYGDIAIEERSSSRLTRNPGAKGFSASERRLLQRVEMERKVVLDERGREWTSAQFARWLSDCAVGSARELDFIVGGSEGFSAAFRKQADFLLSLSRMTLTRDWARTLLLEQIYRAYTIQRGHPYPR
jgi:23S rRNA (pseudouridine1915-N3)-methyltransferase